MLKIVYVLFCCRVFQGILTHTPNTIGTLTLGTSPQTNQDRFPQVLETLKPKKDKFTCVLNLLKSALSEEIENSQCLLDESAQENVLDDLNKLIDDENKDDDDELIQNLVNMNETHTERAMYKKVIKKIASALTKPKNSNITKTQKTVEEIPSMIPIFKPRVIVSNEPNPMPRINQNQRPVTFVPEKIVQTNLNLIPDKTMFNIPCQRAADVLDMTNVRIPDVCPNIDMSVPATFSPIVEEITPSLPNQGPVTLSVNCADVDDTVAVLFKPKAISLLQVYGNLLKNITITVLVPYHMSTLVEH